MMDEAATAFHEGERRAQALAGVVAPSSAFIRAFMTEQHRIFFASLPYVVLGVLSPDGWPVVTFATGVPGFLSSPDETTLCLAWHPISGDPMVEAIAPGRPMAMLGIEFATRRRNRANGVILLNDEDGIRMSVRQSFGNCPKYIRTREATPLLRSPGAVERSPTLDEEARALITSATTFFVASYAPSSAHGGMDVSHRGGPAGFVQVEDDVLTVPDYPGNRYFNTFGNFLENPRAGLLFINFENGDLLHLTGEASVSWTEVGRSFDVRIREVIRRRAALPLDWTEGPEITAVSPSHNA
ncbi:MULTISPECIES: pyridoxamine 5'-phosphate oxidase family protein [Acetobacteraceae]|nr:MULTISPECIES: pyridoxamine 5'-phosphate oxidase family protein [Acetobacteraceae]MCG0996275.1 pyridoxamine 5'-phosphate oxidase family protein [Acetobacter indonesiensis]MCG0999420.1 pyridoxamine 5'-phosphate oxidase family protein [Acetobacter persici]NVN37449.1 pyridoxamine 5'-phosphate oxidase family protein [Komagataeibacter swingsii]